MAETNPELDAINHLLEVEKKASALIKDAMIESEKRLSDAHLKYNSQYKARYDELVSGLESAYQTKHAEIEAKYQKEMDDYKADIESKPLDKQSFDNLLDKLLFA